MSTLLLPASPQTCFTYEVKNDKVVWVDVPQPFKKNLLNVDEIMPAVLAEMLLLVHHQGCTCKVDELCEELTAADPLHIDTRYRLKIQRFLEALALDMSQQQRRLNKSHSTTRQTHAQGFVLRLRIYTPQLPTAFKRHPLFPCL